jgi:energy-coupling factor transport system permease protein
MEAKGFGGTGVRTWARRSRFGGAETAMVVIGAGIAAAAAAGAVAAGTWSFVVS